MEKDLEKDIKNAVEELNILIIKTKEMLTLLKETFCGDNIYLSVPDGFSVPLYKCLSYNYFLDGLTVLPLDYGCYKDGYDNIYSNIAEVEEIYNKFNNYEFPFENPELVAKDIREYIIETESILESENKGLILALEIINSLKNRGFIMVDYNKLLFYIPLVSVTILSLIDRRNYTVSVLRSELYKRR